MRSSSIGLALIATLAFSLTAQALPGMVVESSGVVRWGQYKNIKYTIAVSATSEDLSTTIRDYPASGVSCVLIHGQQPGEPVFSKDGATINDDAAERIIGQIRDANLFDMMPIVVLFNADESCHLESPAAYAQAAEALSTAIKEAELWYLPCVVADGSSDAWGDLDIVDVVKRSAKSMSGVQRKQVVAAGSVDADLNKALSDEVDVIAARVPTLGTLTPMKRTALIEIVNGALVSGGAVSKAINATYTDPKYGFAIDIANSDKGYREMVLAHVFDATDAYHKANFPAIALDPSDTYSLKPGEKEEGFVSLFNGEDLSGWVELTRPENFQVKDGAIELVGKTGGWLRSWDIYGDFVFRAEYWIEEGGNAGFYIRAPAIGRQSRIGFEYQVMGQPASMEPEKTSTGGIYDVKPADGNFMKLGDWNEVQITCKGNHVHIVWNGNVVHDFEYDEFDFMKQRSYRGFIGLQDHSSLVRYRALRIKKLDSE